MNKDTEYVHLHMVNYEPTYLVLMEAANGYRDDVMEMPQARDMLADAVEKHREAMGLRVSDLTDEVDYAAMLDYELKY